MSRHLPDDVYRLPTLMLTFDNKGDIQETYGFDEKTNKQVSLKIFPILAVHGFVLNKTIVMPLSLEDCKGNTHCNSIVIMGSNIERFEPRGNIKDIQNTPVIKEFYNPAHLDASLYVYIKGWFSPQNLKLYNITVDKPRNDIQKPYFRYLTPLPNGIVSTDSQTYINAPYCVKLTFNYLRIRIYRKNRQDAHTEWLVQERKEKQKQILP